jgi:hypothetical protein
VKNTKVVNLGKVRDLLAEWETVRKHILAGNISGFQSMFCDTTTGRETIYVGGVYREDPQKALKAMLRMSAARALTEDDPPQFSVNKS